MSLLPVKEAIERVLADVEPLAAESIPLADAVGRTLAEDLVAEIDQPPFDSSAMDGYAVRAADCTQSQNRLQVTGTVSAGQTDDIELRPGTCARIFTGARLPDGADSVVIQENVTRNGDTIEFAGPVQQYHHVRRRARDFATDKKILARGARLNAHRILLAAASGNNCLPVVRRPRLALLSTGDELVLPGKQLKPGQIYASNAFAIAALAEQAGAAPHALPIAKDSELDLAEKLDLAKDDDILVTLGGASVGDHDIVRPMLERAGATLHFHKIAMRPGKPLFFGTRKTATGIQRIVGLPGNPVSAVICAHLFVVPLIARLLGRDQPLTTEPVLLGTPLSENGPRKHYMRATLDRSTTPPRAMPLSNQDSAFVSGLANADGLIVQPPNAPARKEGETVQFHRFNV